MSDKAKELAEWLQVLADTSQVRRLEYGTAPATIRKAAAELTRLAEVEKAARMALHYLNTPMTGLNLYDDVEPALRAALGAKDKETQA